MQNYHLVTNVVGPELKCYVPSYKMVSLSVLVKKCFNGFYDV